MMLTSWQGFEQYYLSGTSKDYLVVSESSQKVNFSLTAVVPDKLILEKLPYLEKAEVIVLMIARTFNQMISQIEELKIHVYEEQLS
jgi:hypothetical protein